MRCKVGDTAAIVGGMRDNIGHLVRVERASSRSGIWVVKLLCRCTVTVNGERLIAEPGTCGMLADTSMWPLRNAPGVDQTLIIAGFPRDKWGPMNG